MTTVAACGGAGAFIDFYIGKVGQRRVRDWLETWWLKLSYVRWGNLGREEALFAVQVMDRLFGRRFFSARRIILVVLIISVCGILLLTLIMIAHTTLYPAHHFFTVVNCGWLVLIIFSLNASFSITRFAATFVAWLLTKAPYLNLLGLISLLLIQFALLHYWTPLTNYVHIGIWFAFGTIDSTIRFSFWQVIDNIWQNSKTIVGQYAFKLRPLSIAGQFLDPFAVGSDEGNPPVFMWHLSALTNLLPNFTRFSIMAIFIGSFFLRPLQRPIMTLWARIIESEKPIFTLLFGGAAAFATAISEAAKHL